MLKKVVRKTAASMLAHAAFSGSVLAPLAPRETHALSDQLPAPLVKTYDLDVLMVETGGSQPKFADDDVRATLEETGELIDQTTGGAVQFGEIDMTHVTVTPEKSGTAARSGGGATRINSCLS